MLQLFDESQWPELLIEFQPSLRTFGSIYDVVSLHRALSAGKHPDIPNPQCKLDWIIFKTRDEVIIRRAKEEEIKAIDMAKVKTNLGQLGTALWPSDSSQDRQEKMNRMLQAWMDEEIVVDIGVPLPLDAEFVR